MPMMLLFQLFLFFFLFLSSSRSVCLNFINQLYYKINNPLYYTLLTHLHIHTKIDSHIEHKTCTHTTVISTQNNSTNSSCSFIFSSRCWNSNRHEIKQTQTQSTPEKMNSFVILFLKTSLYYLEEATE